MSDDIHKQWQHYLIYFDKYVNVFCVSFFFFSKFCCITMHTLHRRADSGALNHFFFYLAKLPRDESGRAVEYATRQYVWYVSRINRELC